ncbi:MAG: hypothetical protein K2N84_07485 [Clostridia bacterium]|nr:hypothetical protein [Clostridia bacterium]
MTKLRKRLLQTFVIALCISLFACLFAACGDNTPDDNAVTYTVTVMKDAETPASNVSVQIRKGGATFERVNTNAQGRAEFDLVPDSYEVVLSKLPAHYTVPQSASLTLTSDNRAITVTLEKSFVYTVKLVNPDGTPFYAEGVMVGICTFGDNCKTPVVLGEDGVAEIEEDPDNYHVQILELPVGYDYPHDEHGYYTGEDNTFSATDTEMTITIISATSVTSVSPMMDTEKKTSSESLPAYDAAAQRFVSYKHTKELKANEIAYYCIDAEISGRYDFYTKGSNLFLSNGTEFVVGEAGNYMPQTLVCEAGKPYYFKAINHGSSTVTAEFVVTAPFSSYIEQRGKGAVLEVTVGKEDTNAIIAFEATEAGVYTVSVEGDTRTAIATSRATPNEFVETAPADSAYTANASATFVAYTSAVQSKGQTHIAITAKANSYPAKLNVKIDKTTAIADTYTTVEVEEKLTQYIKPAGQELQGVSMDGTAKLVYNAADKYYHLGTVSGPVVVVNITGALDTNRFEAGCALAYMELVNSYLATYKFVTRQEFGETTLDYTVFLRGFDEYNYTNGTHGPVASIPTEITAQTYYAKYVNEDGVYPLTEELKAFLEKFSEVNATAFSWQIPTGVKAENMWLFPCYYYVEATQADPIVGEYKFVSLTEEGKTYSVGAAYSGYNGAVAYGLKDGKLTANSSIIRINKNGSFSVLPYNSTDEIYDSAYDSGTWTKNGNVYTFECENGTMTYSNGTLTYDDGQGSVIIYKV